MTPLVFLFTLSKLAKLTVFSSEIIIDISSTVVDESKEIVLLEFAFLDSNTSHCMNCIVWKQSILDLEDILVIFLALVKVVDSQGRGFCGEAKYSLLELSVRALSNIALLA